MKNDTIYNSFDFHKLQWDTDFFGVNCAKAILYKPLKLEEWNKLNESFKGNQFISLENRNSNPVNAQWIGKHSSAFLVDVNIQFKKKLSGLCEECKRIKIRRALERNERIIDIADFGFSKFIDDLELAKRNGSQVYRQWLINSFGKQDKFYATSEDKNGQVNGFLLYSYIENKCIIELIAVSEAKSGIGSDLFMAVEYEAFKNGSDEICVGTQVRNMGAINFYHKMGCKQIGCHQIYHLWNNEI